MNNNIPNQILLHECILFHLFSDVYKYVGGLEGKVSILPSKMQVNLL